MIKPNTAALRLKKGRTFKVTFNQVIDISKLMWMGHPSTMPPSKLYSYEWKYRVRKTPLLDVVLDPINNNVLISSRDQDTKIPWQMEAIMFAREVRELLIDKKGVKDLSKLEEKKENIKRSPSSGQFFKNGKSISLPVWEGYLLLKDKKKVTNEELLKLGIDKVKNAEKNYINYIAQVAKDREHRVIKTILDITIE